MNIFMTGFLAETNSFSPIPTGENAFDGNLYFGDATAYPASIASLPLHVWRKRGEADGASLTESVCANAGAGGLLSRAFFEGIRSRILEDLAKAGPQDIIMLHLHGSMVAHGYDDCEGDILTRVRELVGEKVIIGVELDLHCAVSQAMIDEADIIVTYKESPHTDTGERATEIYDLCTAAFRGEIDPVIEMVDCGVIGTWSTRDEPLAGLLGEMQSSEGRDGILSISFAHCFAFCDVPDNGGKVLVIADGDRDVARQAARRFVGKIWDVRGSAVWHSSDLEESLDAVEASPDRCIVLADYCDNAGGGAPSDSTFILHEVLKRKLTSVVSGVHWDPIAVDFCKDAGIGAVLDLRIGGKACRQSGDPLDLNVTVKGIIENANQPFGDAMVSLGDAVWIQAKNGLDIILSSLRQQTFDPFVFTQFGIDLKEKKLIIVKSAVHFRVGFLPIASEIRYARTKGLLGIDYAQIPFKKFRKDYWPKSEVPRYAKVSGE